MSIMGKIQPHAATQIPEPPLARFLFADTRMAWLWLVIRVYAGYEWFNAGWEKLTGYTVYGAPAHAAWVFTSGTGSAISGFVKGALVKNTGTNPSVSDWYAWFLTNFVQPFPAFWAYAITFGELLVGLGLFVGALTGVAAFFGVFMNLNYILAGTISTNPLLGFLGLFLILAWRIAGYYGVDRYLLPALGTPWTGSLARKPAVQAVPSSTMTPTAPIS